MVVYCPIVVAKQLVYPAGSIYTGPVKKKTTKRNAMILITLSIIMSGIGYTIEGDNSREIAERCEDDVYRVLNSDECDSNNMSTRAEIGSFINGCGGILCCFGIIMLIVGASTPNAAPRAYVVQQPVMPTHTTIIQQQATPSTGGMPVNQPKAEPSTSSKSAAPTMADIESMANQARNLELARDFDKAADMYQKAGMFAEAGRIRKTYLENDKPVVQIGQIGDSVVKDSVIISDKAEPICHNCGAETQANWKFCPSCNTPL
ncbi:zinc ribbon domain-containing protein [Euryarchaeota archaeon]|nr:zinc ribbon domain-containing protein [Euryarchaeota archaeon]